VRVFVSSDSTQTAPSPVTTPWAQATAVLPARRFVAGSIFQRKLFAALQPDCGPPAAQIAPSPAVTPRTLRPVLVVATTVLRAGSMRETDAPVLFAVHTLPKATTTFSGWAPMLILVTTALLRGSTFPSVTLEESPVPFADFGDRRDRNRAN
jgi:hypothetical protein